MLAQKIAAPPQNCAEQPTLLLQEWNLRHNLEPVTTEQIRPKKTCQHSDQETEITEELYRVR